MPTSAMEQINTTFTIFDNDYLSPFYNIIYILSKPILLILAFLVIIRISRIIFKRYDLIVEGFINSSGDIEIDNRLSGFRQLAREELIHWLDFVQEIATASLSESGLSGSRPFEYIPMPRDMPDPTLGELAASLENITPDKVKPIIHIINILFPPQGIKVSCVLQRLTDADRVGMTVRIDDISRKQESRVHTIWETNEPDKLKESQKKSLDERYIALKGPVAFRLAAEICRMRMLDKIETPWGYSMGEDERNEKRGQIHNFIGFMHLYFGLSYIPECCPDMLEIFRSISEDFKISKKLFKGWYLPYENLGDLYRRQGIYVSDCEAKCEKSLDKPSARGYEFQRRAIIEYEAALKKADMSEHIEQAELEIVQNRIKIDRAIARLLTGVTEQIEIAKKEIKDVDKPGFIQREVSARSLYNLAGWYSLARSHYSNEDYVLKWASICLAYSLARDRHGLSVNRDYGLIWDSAEDDPDLKEVRAQFALEPLKFELSLKLIEDPFVTNYKRRFEYAMNDVIWKAGWGSPNVMPPGY